MSDDYTHGDNVADHDYIIDGDKPMTKREMELVDEMNDYYDDLSRRTINGNLHLANMEVHEYDGLKFVTESPQPGAIRMTIYRGEETTPMSTEVYGNECQ